MEVFMWKFEQTSTWKLPHGSSPCGIFFAIWAPCGSRRHVEKITFFKAKMAFFQVGVSAMWNFSCENLSKVPHERSPCGSSTWRGVPHGAQIGKKCHMRTRVAHCHMDTMWQLRRVTVAVFEDFFRVAIVTCGCGICKV